MIADRLLRGAAKLWWLKTYNDSGLVPVPRDSPSVRSGHAEADRVLLLGNGAAGGWQVLTWGLALAGRTAVHVQRLTGRGCDLDQVGDEVMNLGSASAWLGGRRLTAYDAVLVVVGFSDAVRLTPVARWTEDLGALLEDVLARVRPDVEVVVAGIEPIQVARVFGGPLGVVAQRHAERLNAATAEVAARFERVATVALAGPAGSAAAKASATYDAWAAELAPALAAGIGRTSRRGAQPALPLLPEVGPSPATRDDWTTLRALLEAAKRDLRADVAWIGFLDGSRYTLPLVSIGNAPGAVPLELTYCRTTVEQDSTLTVPNRDRDPRFADNPFLDVVRFQSYVGHPLHGEDGAPVGTFCVASITPRRRRAADEVALRRFAADAEVELTRMREVAPG